VGYWQSDPPRHQEISGNPYIAFHPITHILIAPVVSDNNPPRNTHVTGKRKAVAQILQALSRFRSDNYQGPIRSIAILMVGRYGDSILLTKLLRQLKAAIPDCSIHVITSRKNTEAFFRYSPYVTSTFCLKDGIGSWLKFLFTHRYDVLFNPKDEPSTSNLLLSTFLRSRIKVSLAHEYHKGIFDRLVDFDHLSHVTVQNAGLLATLGNHAEAYADLRPEMPHYPVSPTIKAFCDSIRGRQCIGINLSAGDASRYWTMEKWAGLMELFPEEKFIVFAAGDDRNDKAFLETSHANVIPSPATANIGEVGSIVKELKLIISPDTSLVHIASCSDTPIIALFSNDLKTMQCYSPLSSQRMMVASDTAAVRDIRIDNVAQALHHLLDQKGDVDQKGDIL
jgi:ADP-heptose:LPS heptosyltransferase